jgi:hypothetical protein
MGFLSFPARNSIVTAHLFVRTDSNSTLSLHTLDYFRYRAPNYTYAGTGIRWMWDTKSADCLLQSFNASDATFRPMLRRSFSFPDVAIVLDMDEARKAGCHTLAQVIS